MFGSVGGVWGGCWRGVLGWGLDRVLERGLWVGVLVEGSLGGVLGGGLGRVLGRGLWLEVLEFGFRAQGVFTSEGSLLGQWEFS